MANKTKETEFFEAFQRRDITTAKRLLRDVNPSRLKDWRTSEDRTCLHVAVLAGDKGLFQEVAKKLEDKLDAELCDCANNEGETPLKVAVSLGFREAVEILITRTSNALHYVVELNQVKLVEFLMQKKVVLSELINQPYQAATNPPDKENCAKNPSDHEGHGDTTDQPIILLGDTPLHIAARNKHGQMVNLLVKVPDEERPPIVLQGDTPLHIAARNKYEHMVNLLVKVRGVNKLALNSEGKTPFEIAREVIEYHESFRIIRRLEPYGGNPRSFMYCAPQVSQKKLMVARAKLNEAYETRRNAELVVAALLAAMTCAAAFTVPGGFDSDSKEMKELGSPLLIHLTSFKLFLIFDCIAFFLSLFVCIMWEMSSELTTGDKMLFMTVNSLVVCCSFGSTSFAFMCAVYSMLARKVETFSWVVLGSLIAIASFGVIAFIRQLVMFASTRARFHRLCGVSCVVDDFAEKVWSLEERWGILKPFRSGGERYQDLITGHRKFREHNSPSSAAHENKSSSSSHLALEL